MNEKNFLLFLPNELLIDICRQIGLKNTVSLSKTSKMMHKFLSGYIWNSSLFNKDLGKLLLQYGTEGEQAKAANLIKKNPHLLYQRIPYVDHWTGRGFPRVSFWEYILWVRDTRYMARMALDHLPDAKEGKRIRHILLGQYKHLQKRGLTTYVEKGKAQQEQTFPIMELIHALGQFVQNASHWTNKEIAQHWVGVVGDVQQCLPAHVRQHYCADVPFISENGDPPRFTDPSFPRDLHIWIYRFFPAMEWRPVCEGSPEDEKIGTKFAVVRGKNSGIGGFFSNARPNARARLIAWPKKKDVLIDLRALSALASQRDNDFQEIRPALQSTPPEEHTNNEVRPNM